MKRNDLNAIITGIVHRYIEDGWVLEMDNASYSDVVGVHFLSRGRERVAVGIRRPELKEVSGDARFANLRGAGLAHPVRVPRPEGVLRLGRA